jgi:hypothetical protein
MIREKQNKHEQKKRSTQIPIVEWEECEHEQKGRNTRPKKY